MYELETLIFLLYWLSCSMPFAVHAKQFVFTPIHTFLSINEVPSPPIGEQESWMSTIAHSKGWTDINFASPQHLF